MKGTSKKKGQIKNEKANKAANISPIDTTRTDEDYAKGFGKSRKKVERTPPGMALKGTYLTWEEELARELHHVFTDKEEKGMIAEINDFLNTGDIEVDPVVESRESQEAVSETPPETSRKRINRNLELTSVKKQKQDTASKPQQEMRDKEQREIYEINEFFNSGDIEVDPVLEDKNENTTESQICFMEVINNQPPNMEAIKFDTNRENIVARGNALIYVYVKGDKVDITSINSCRVFSDICDLIQRKPDITQSNRSLRILCKDETEKNIFMDTSDLAGHRVVFSEPYTKTSKFANSASRGIIFDVDEELSDDEISLKIGIPAKRIIKKVRGENKITRQVILFFDDGIP